MRSVFSDVHAAGENDQNYFLPEGKKLCEDFFDSPYYGHQILLKSMVLFGSAKLKGHIN